MRRATNLWVRLPFLLIVLLVPVYAAYVMQPGVGYFHDDGVYLVNAFSLVSGHGFRTLSLPSEPFQTKYPILYPALLAAWWEWLPEFPANAAAFKLLSCGAAVAWSYSTYRLTYRETGSETMAGWIAALTLTSPWVVFLSASVLPDTLFALLSTLTLLTAGKSESARRWVGVALLASAALLLRSAGIALIAAVPLVCLLQRRWRTAAIFCVACAVITGPWFAWQTAHGSAADAVGNYYTKLSYRHGFVWSLSLPNALRTMGLNLLTQVATFCPVTGVYTRLNALAGVLAVIGLGRRVWLNKLSLPVVWLLIYSGLLVCWVAPPVRYNVPLQGIGLLLAMESALPIARRLSIPRAWCVAAAFGCGILASISLYQLRALTVAAGAPAYSMAAPDNWRATREGIEWLKQHTPADAVIASNYDPVLFLFTQRKAIRPFSAEPFELFFDPAPDKQPLGPPDRLRNRLKANGVTYLMITPMRQFPEERFFREQLAALRQSAPDAFRLEASFAGGGYYILRVDAAKL